VHRRSILTLTLLMWRIWWAPNNASGWQMGFNLAFKGLITLQRDATQSSLFIILQVHSSCFGCQPHPSSGVHKTVTTVSDTGHIFCAATSLQRGQVNLEGGSCTKNMTSTGDCSYSFVCSWWWVCLTPETCRMILQNNK